MKAAHSESAAPKSTAGGQKVLKIAIAGAGAIGTLFGTSMVKGGHDVLFMDGWPALIEAMKKDPVAHRINADGTEEDIPVKVCAFNEAPKEEFDLIWLTVKSTQTDSTMKTLHDHGLIGKNTIVLTLQGGFDNPETIVKYQTNPRFVLFGKTSCSSSGVPGRMMTIQKFAIADTTVWALGDDKNATPDPRVKEIADIINATGLPLTLTPQAIPDRWKMLLYYPTNIAVSAVLNLDFQTVWNNQATAQLLTNLAKEVALIAKLEGVDSKYFNEEIAVAAVKKLAEEECPQHQGSMNQDVKKKLKTENEATAGALLNLAKKHNVELPYTQTIYSLINCKENSYGKEVQ